jgi:AraC-like DNA-binding protein
LKSNDIEYQFEKSDKSLSDFVESFWMLANYADNEHQIVILPDGRFDIIFSLTDNTIFKATLKGLDTEPEQQTIPANTILFAISFKLLAIEYLIDEKVNLLLNEGLELPIDFWEITKNDFTDFNTFCEKISTKLFSLIKPNIDIRKQQLFDLIYTSNGTLTVKELSEKVFWSSRQINRYFNQTFGISLKTYCNIFRFKASLNHIKKGKLFPELNFTDQTHFIKEVKKMSGVTPKELSKNENDRFILLSTLH